ncbi:hypothetical protein ABIB39_000201 [Mucilaginibacter sp. UYP27]
MVSIPALLILLIKILQRILILFATKEVYQIKERFVVGGVFERVLGNREFRIIRQELVHKGCQLVNGEAQLFAVYFGFYNGYLLLIVTLCCILLIPDSTK